MKNISKPLTWLAAALLLLGAGAYFRLASIHPRLEAMILLVLLSGGFMVFWGIQKKLQREKNLGHLETERLLAAQEDTNRKLVQANRLAQDGAQKLAVTLDSIGDAVIATDAQARITLLNPVAQKLTGWTLAQAIGQPVDEVFKIVNKANREPVTVPVLATLAHGTVQGLANHTLLLSRDGPQYDIADSCAPIRDANGQVVGAVLVFRNVTEEYAAQQALRQVSALQKAIFNSANFSSIATDAKGVIQIFNVGAERMLGYTAAEVVNRVTPADLSDPQEMVARATSLSLELGTEIAAGFESLAFKASRGIEDIDERTYICKDGHRLPALVSVTALRDEVDAIIGYLLIGTDNTARKEAEEALLKAGALQSAIFNSANFSSIATDAKGVIQIFNVGAERMLGYSAAEVMNKITPADISDPQELIARAETLSVELGTPITPGFESLVFKASRGIEDIYELTYIRKDGTRFPAVVNVTALRDAQDAIIGYLLIGTDNTARRAAEVERERLDRALRDKNAELEAARAAADKANQAKSEFLSGMSHELRSPLNAILGFAQLMESGTPLPTPSQKASIDQILRAGWYLLELINEVLDLALIESGRLSLSREPVSLPDVLQDCQTLMASAALKKEVSLHFAPLAAPCFVSADHTRLKQVVINLLSNAIKYNRHGGNVTVSCSERAAGRVRLSVQDTGEGLSPDKLAQLFQPFNRLGKEDSDEEGTGIGLVVSKRLVEQMGGELGVISSVGAGCVFWVELALIGAPQFTDVADEMLLPQVTPLPNGVRVRTLLYVEDNRANMELVRQLIARRPDLRLFGAEDATRGIALAREHQPDLILLDINLPGINGLQALKILQEDESTRHIPVLALSANAMPRDIERGLAAGFLRYLTKPIRVTEFMDALDAGLALAQTRRAPGLGQEVLDAT